MMKSYIFHVSLPGTGRTWRKIELRADQRLHDLHRDFLSIPAETVRVAAIDGAADQAWLAEIPSIVILRQVWMQQFMVEAGRLCLF